MRRASDAKQNIAPSASKLQRRSETSDSFPRSSEETIRSPRRPSAVR